MDAELREHSEAIRAYRVSPERDEGRMSKEQPFRTDVFEQSEKTAQKRQAKTSLSTKRLPLDKGKPRAREGECRIATH